MSDDRIFCSFCKAFTEHVTIKSGNEHLVRCQICRNVHSIEPERTRLASLGASGKERSCWWTMASRTWWSRR